MVKTGWYYDDQVNNVMTSVTLHSNMWWQEKEGNKDEGEWIPWFDKKTDNEVDDDTFVNLVGMKNQGTVYGYGITPIARSILTEDFNVSVFNTWTDFGSDMISPLWDEVRRSAAYVKNAINISGELINNSKNLNPEDGFGSKIGRKVGEIAEKITEWVDIPDAVQYLNKALVTQGTRFSYYGGTGFSFGNLGMKFTVFPKYIDGEVVTVTDQLRKFYPYVIGKLEPFDLKANINGTEYNAANLLGGSYEGLLQWQSPPGGFESELKNIDIIQKGTLKLRVGPHYCLTNLVCQEANFTYSKQMVKFPVNGKNKISPLFCDVSLTLRPATLYSDIMMKKFVSGEGTYVDNNTWKTYYEIKPCDDLSKAEKNDIDKFPANLLPQVIEYAEEQKGTSINFKLNDSLNEKIEKFNSLYAKYK